MKEEIQVLALLSIWNKSNYNIQYTSMEMWTINSGVQKKPPFEELLNQSKNYRTNYCAKILS